MRLGETRSRSASARRLSPRSWRTARRRSPMSPYSGAEPWSRRRATGTSSRPRVRWYAPLGRGARNPVAERASTLDTRRFAASGVCTTIGHPISNRADDEVLAMTIDAPQRRPASEATPGDGMPPPPPPPTRRPFASPGAQTVDGEERVNPDRLRTYRLGRAKAALAASDLGAMLLFDFNNIRYVTSTHIGEWARDKMTRYSLLTRGGEPHLWDFGSAAKHHRLYCPWLPPENVNGGMIGLRGAVAPEAGLFTRAAKDVAAILKAEGVADMPIGVDIVEPPMLAALQAEGVRVLDAQQVMLNAREVKSIDEITLLNTACAMVDGAYQLISERLKPGIKESQLVAEVTKLLFDMGSEHVDNINAVSGERCSPHPHVFSDRLIRPGDQAFFDIIQTFVGYKTCYYRTFPVGP